MGDVVELECIINPSGIEPVDVKVLVLPDAVEEKTAGGIIMPEQARDRERMAQTRGTLVACGGGAFEDWNDNAYRPKPGERVIIDRYAGVRVEGADGENYQLINDTDVLAVLSREKEE